MNKESWLYKQEEVDRILILHNSLFDLYVKEQEDNDIAKMKYENERGKTALIMKSEQIEEKVIDKKGEETIKYKNKYTDTTLEYALDQIYEDKINQFIVNKYKFKAVENKLKLIMEKLLLVKKYLVTN